jgi:hypothetical protein
VVPWFLICTPFVLFFLFFLFKLFLLTAYRYIIGEWYTWLNNIKIGNQSPNSLRDSIMPCAVKSSFENRFPDLSLSGDQSYRLQYLLWQKWVFTFQIGDNFFLYLKSGILLCSWVVSVCFLDEGLCCWMFAWFFLIRWFTVQLQS